VEERDVDPQPAGDLPNALVEHRVARDPDDAVVRIAPAQREADHVAGDGPAERRTVPAGASP
jgi:hypothetical protein